MHRKLNILPNMENWCIGWPTELPIPLIAEWVTQPNCQSHVLALLLYTNDFRDISITCNVGHG